MKISTLIAQLEETQRLFGDLQVTVMQENDGELDYMEVLGVSLDDFDGEKTRKVVLGLDFAWVDDKD